MKVIDAPTLKNKNVEENLLIEWYVHSLFFFFFQSQIQKNGQRKVPI